MLEDQSFTSVVSWDRDGNCVVVHDVVEFTKSILPHMFQHSNFASFARQMHIYNSDMAKSQDSEWPGRELTWAFMHPDFKDGQDALVNCKMRVPAMHQAEAGGVDNNNASNSPTNANNILSNPHNSASSRSSLLGLGGSTLMVLRIRRLTSQDGVVGLGGSMPMVGRLEKADPEPKGPGSE